MIVGGESGPGARPLNAEWVTEIRDQCIRSGVVFFFKVGRCPKKKKNGTQAPKGSHVGSNACRG